MNKIRPGATDLQLINAFKKNNNEYAFGMICKRYHKDINNHLIANTRNNFYLRNFIDDAVNETFVEFWEKLKLNKYQEKGAAKAYLQKIAYRKLMKMSNQNMKPIGNGAEISDEENYNELNELLVEDLINYKNISNEAFKFLKQICIEIISLKYYNKMNDTEIFEKFPEELKSIKNVRKRRSKCMEKLRKKSEQILKQTKEVATLKS